MLKKTVIASLIFAFLSGCSFSGRVGDGSAHLILDLQKEEQEYE